MPDEPKILSVGEEALQRFTQLNQSRYITNEDLESIPGREFTATIKSLQTEDVKPCISDGKRIDGGESRVVELDRPEGKKRFIILGKESMKACLRVFGTSYANWVGSQVKISLVMNKGRKEKRVTPVNTEKGK